jgi:tetratricopeptide (TPR) repeat protein
MEVTVSDDLNLKLAKRNGGGDTAGKTLLRVSAAVLLVACAILVLQIAGMWGGGRGGEQLSAERLEALALKLEKQGIRAAATRAWEDYLMAAGANDEKRARIWYRIGTIHQATGAYEEALSAYYRSESFASVADLEMEISRRVAECLESLGRFAALSSELERRTAVPGADASGEDVLAEIGDRKITKADLGAMIEAEVDAQLSQLAGSLTPEERKAQKEMLLENIRKQGGTGQWLERFIAEELLYRRAREEGLQEDEEYRIILRNLERKVLAQRLIDRAIAAEVSVTPNEMQAYYDANIEAFTEEGKTKPFEEVRDRIYIAIRSEKEMEVQRRILDELKERYDVVIHQSKIEGS